MTNLQAIEYIDSIMSNYDNPIYVEKDNSKYRLCSIWLSDKDIIALQMGKEALKNFKVQIEGNIND